MLAYVRKFITALLGNSAFITELYAIDPGHARNVTMILTAIATTLAVYAVPNSGRVVRSVGNGTSAV